MKRVEEKDMKPKRGFADDLRLSKLPKRPDPNAIKPKRMDAAAILKQLAEIRERLPKATGALRKPGQTGATRTTFTKVLRTDDAMADFEEQAVIDALEQMAAEIHEFVEEKRARALELALEAYYVCEELSLDPAHANLIPQVEAMRAAYQKDFGKPIPPKKK
jgi:hypothetical protein